MFQRQRAQEFLKPLFAVTDPKKAGELLKQFKHSIFPEDRFDDLKYHRMASKMFERMRNVNMFIKPVGNGIM